LTTKELIIVGGPNGAGKTTFAQQYILEHPQTYLSADLIAEQLAPGDPTSMRFAAGRKFLTEVRQLIDGPYILIIESTLSGIGIRRILEKAMRHQFEITIVFVYLDSADTCVARVRERVRKGGHHVPESDIRRRYPRSKKRFWQVYRRIAEHWMMVYNHSSEFENVAKGDRHGTHVMN